MRSARIPDGKANDDEFTPYTFIDGKLAAVGWHALGGPRTAGERTATQRNIEAAQIKRWFCRCY